MLHFSDTQWLGDDKVFGSLILGGYDASKSGSKNMSVAFGTDISRDLSVDLQSITITTAQGNKTPLLSKGIFTFIDSTVPHIWLPLDACQNFEQAFGLTWDSTTELYLVDNSLHEKLVSQNASLTFTIANQTSGGSSLDIVLPYASFDLEVDFPIVENKTRYFPLKRAANDTQYTLGRAFLQEA
jgi:Eukaryotic aspartyl protease